MRFTWLSELYGNILESIYQHISNTLKDIKLPNITCNNLTLFQNQVVEVLNWWRPELIYARIVTESNAAMEHIIKACVFYLLLCLCIYKLIFWPRVRKLFKFINNIYMPKRVKNNVLCVIAHPDDEVMFFGPLLYTLAQRQDCQVYLMCLSNGNFEKQSELRREELWSSCKVLGIPDSNIMLINATNLPDDPNVEWNPEIVANFILNTIERLDIQSVFTFDRDGVSQHPNHCAVYFAAASLCLTNLMPKTCKFYTLDSVNIVRKYISIFDILCTGFISRYWCVLSWRNVSTIRRAMREHKSQMRWYRWLYIYFSRYMIINSFRELNLADVELEMQIND